MDPEALILQNEAFAPRPDLLVVLDIDPAVGVSRVQKRDGAGNEFEQVEDLRRCAAIFEKLNGRHNTLHVDANKSIEEITEIILKKVYEGPLYRAACVRADTTPCDFVYCSERMTGTCLYPQLGGLVPVEIPPAVKPQ